jgi:hypothetical protein
MNGLLRAGLGFASRSGLLAAAAAIVAVSVVVGIGGAFAFGLYQVGGPGTAASGAGLATPAPSVAAIEVETFDSPPVGAGGPAAWKLAGNADVIVTPATGDRSLRLRTSRTGAEASACRSLPGAATSTIRLEFDLLVGKAVSAARLLSLNAGPDLLLSLKVDPEGRLTTRPPAPSASVDPSTRTPISWQRVAIEIDPRGHRVMWSETDQDGGEVAAGVRAVPGLERLPGGTVCLHSPKDTPAGWIAVDNLAIE